MSLKSHEEPYFAQFVNEVCKNGKFLEVAFRKFGAEFYAELATEKLFNRPYVTYHESSNNHKVYHNELEFRTFDDLDQLAERYEQHVEVLHNRYLGDDAIPSYHDCLDLRAFDDVRKCFNSHSLPRLQSVSTHLEMSMSDKYGMAEFIQYCTTGDLPFNTRAPANKLVENEYRAITYTRGKERFILNNEEFKIWNMKKGTSMIWASPAFIRRAIDFCVIAHLPTNTKFQQRPKNLAIA